MHCYIDLLMYIYILLSRELVLQTSEEQYKQWKRFGIVMKKCVTSTSTRESIVPYVALPARRDGLLPNLVGWMDRALPYAIYGRIVLSVPL